MSAGSVLAAASSTAEPTTAECVADGAVPTPAERRRFISSRISVNFSRSAGAGEFCGAGEGGDAAALSLQPAAPLLRQPTLSLEKLLWTEALPSGALTAVELVAEPTAGISSLLLASSDACELQEAGMMLAGGRGEDRGDGPAPPMLPLAVVEVPPKPIVRDALGCLGSAVALATTDAAAAAAAEAAATAADRPGGGEMRRVRSRTVFC
mmetsp:Transcript_56380/g.112043  ORF Transcript_56380/g.112043 Transcript_56380/m.112043 type:complete len:209 (-) Transcript_56380:1516-2142(-)